MLAKSLLVIAGVAVVGVVGYKILKKKNVSKKIQDTVSTVKTKAASFIDGAAESFKEGYASAV
jgi:hypothetical protein